MTTVKANGDTIEHIAWLNVTYDDSGLPAQDEGDSTDLWNWGECALHSKWNLRVIRYRIRKPKGLAILQEILREVERTDEMV